jgi:magnesium transporter
MPDPRLFKAASEPDLATLADDSDDARSPADTSPQPRAAFVPGWVGAQLGDISVPPSLGLGESHPTAPGLPRSASPRNTVADGGLGVGSSDVSLPPPGISSSSPLMSHLRSSRSLRSPPPESPSQNYITSVSFSDYIQVESGHHPHLSLHDDDEDGMEQTVSRRTSNYRWPSSQPSSPRVNSQREAHRLLLPHSGSPPNVLGLADMLDADRSYHHRIAASSPNLPSAMLPAPFVSSPPPDNIGPPCSPPPTPYLALPRHDSSATIGSSMPTPGGAVSSASTFVFDNRLFPGLPTPVVTPAPPLENGAGTAYFALREFAGSGGDGGGGYAGGDRGDSKNDGAGNVGMDSEHTFSHLPPSTGPIECAAQEELIDRLKVSDVQGDTTLVESSQAARWYKLACCEILADGTVNDRLLSRAEIMQAARETMPKNAPSPKVVARWLGRPEEESSELREFSARYGGGKEASHKAMQKALRNYLRNSLQPRDIRQVDPAFSAKPALWVRHSALVVSLEGVRAIVLHNRIFLFDPDNSVVHTAINVIQQSIMTSPDLLEDPNMPFEFKALEGIFITGIMGLEREFNELKPNISRHLNELPNQLTTKMLEELRANKQTLNQFMSRASNVRGVLEALLDEDEDMANMYLTEKHNLPSHSREVVDHDEVEMLLEAYMQVVDELVNRADLLSNEIEDTEDLVMIHLDTLRNRLLSVELALSVVSMTFGFGGFMGGIFGMNLQIPLYESSASKFYFLGVVVIVVLFVVIVPWVSLSALKRRGLYSFR